jgi:phenylacetate-CoA ligase
MSVITGHRLPANKELKLLKTYNISILAGTTSYIYNLTCEMEPLYNLRSLNLKNIMIGSEPLPKAIRDKIEKTWNTKAYQGYGLTEVGTSIAGECKQQNGMHITESDFYIEITDPITGERLKDGQIGEVTITTLDREGMPILRYRTHDLGLIMPEPCPCGLPFRRIKIKGRTDNMVPIGSGDNLFPSECDEAILNIPGVIDYQVILVKKHNKDHITVIVETKSITKKIQKKIETAVMKIPAIRDGVGDSKTIDKPEIKLVKQDTIDKTSSKAKRIVDNRNLYE